MKPYYSDDRAVLHHGDCLEVLAALPDASVDAIVTDPPYGLEFMGKEWDSFKGANDWGRLGDTTPWKERPKGGADPFQGDRPRFHAGKPFQQWCAEWAREALRVLKPGGTMLSFGGTRTWHRLACAAEDAGFEIRDSLAWLHAQGFPKNLNVTKALESLPACSCGVGAEVGSDRLGVVDAAGPASPVRAGVGTEAGAVSLARPTTDAAGRVWPKVRPAAPRGASDVDTLDEVTAREGLPVVLGPLAVAGTAEGQEVVGAVRFVEVNPEALRDEVVGQEPVDPTTVSTLPVALDDCGCDIHPSSALVLPLAATPGRVPIPRHAVTVGGGHAAAGAVDGFVGPAAELLSADDADMDTVSSTLHGPHSTAERAARCESCGGVVGEIPQGLGTALKPAFEPIVVARKPLAGTVAQNVLAHGTGALNIDGCRVEGEAQPFGNGTKRTAGIMGDSEPRGQWSPTAAGRWPANVILDESQAAALDAMSGEAGGGTGRSTRGGGDGGDWNPTDRTEKAGQTVRGDGREIGYGDLGGASRFFYTAKAASAERPKANGIAHPTVKPLDLMRWLVRLVTPPGGVVLDPFAGSGTTLEAAIVEGFRCIGIEREADYLPLIDQRIARACPPLDFTEETA